MNNELRIIISGGGIPVLAQNNRLQGASAVIEKDLAAGKLAEKLDADMLVILTSVDKVCLNFGREIACETYQIVGSSSLVTSGSLCNIFRCLCYFHYFSSPLSEFRLF